MRRVISGLVGAVLVGQLVAATALGAASAFKGQWTSTDTDGSFQLLLVSSGSSPSVVYQDFSASTCARFGPSTHWVASGSGSVEGNDLFVHFHHSGCGTFTIGEYDDFWTYAPGSDTLIDSFGIVWTRLR